MVYHPNPDGYELKDTDNVATCAACEWTFVTDIGIKVAEMMVVLHVLVRHPDLYQRGTGRDPLDAEAEYAELLAHPDIRSCL